MASVLLLNADAQPLSLLPLSTISWQNAIKAYYLQKVDIIKHYEDKFINGVSIQMPMPSVVMLRKFHRRPKVAKFSRRNLYVRDNYKCQYCGEKFISDHLTIDHVIPKSLGGGTSWENCATACRPCNSDKGSKLIKPINTPINPSWYHINNSSKYFNITIPDPAWQDYIQWPEEKVAIDSNFSFHY